jgi:hypothetical protein
MKKVLLYLAVAAFFLSSCKKDSSHNEGGSTPGKKYAVNFSVSGFTQTITGGDSSSLATKGTHNALAIGPRNLSLASSASILYYYVYNSSGALVSSLTQLSSNPNFGTIQDTLAAGTYTVVMAAGQTHFVSDQTNQYSTATLTYIGKLPGYPAEWSDSFSKVFTVTISNQAISQSVQLARMVGAVQLDIKDAIPSNVYSLQMQFEYDYSTYAISTGQITDQTAFPYTDTIPTSARGTTNFKTTAIVLNTSTPMEVIITAYDNTNKVIATTSVTNVNCYKNTTTVLSGKLFTSNVNWGVSVNNTWDPTTINISF